MLGQLQHSARAKERPLQGAAGNRQETWLRHATLSSVETPTPSAATNDPFGSAAGQKPHPGRLAEGGFFHATETATLLFINQAFFNSPTLTSPF
jgi:hypothetical protein